MEEASNQHRQGRGDGQLIVELLCQADTLLRDELRTYLDNGSSPEIIFLLDAQLNISRAIEALYDGRLYKHHS